MVFSNHHPGEFWLLLKKKKRKMKMEIFKTEFLNKNSHHSSTLNQPLASKSSSASVSSRRCCRCSQRKPSPLRDKRSTEIDKKTLGIISEFEPNGT